MTRTYDLPEDHDDDGWVAQLTQEDAQNLLLNWERSAARSRRIVAQIRATADQPLPRATGDTPPPGTPVQVLLIWSHETDALKATLNPVLSVLVDAGFIPDAHPDGGSQGWEWRNL